MAETDMQATATETAVDAMQDTENTEATETIQAADTMETAAAPEEPEEISYHTVEKEGSVTAIWEMQGRRHLRTIDPRSGEGKNILSLFTSEHHDEESAAA